jgi:uncharacterized protein (DUF362 family)
MGNQSSYRVRAVHCDHRASDEEVYVALKQATAPLDRSWDKLRRAQSIAIKFNQDFPPDKLVIWEGQRQQLISDSVARAVLRLLRENTSARLFCAESSYHLIYDGTTLDESTHLAPVFREFDVQYIDGHTDNVTWHEAPGGGSMFRRYPVSKRITDCDAFISVQKMKNHSFMGITLTTKNLFGLMPVRPFGRPRAYYHHLVRMPYMLADIARIFNPALSILDALVGQAAREWGDGKGNGRMVDGLVAGDHVIATDACGAYLMGHDPTADWPTPPFHRDRNHLLASAEAGYGTVNLSEIDFVSDLMPQPEGTFFSQVTDPDELIVSWRRTMCEQALYYRDHLSQFEPYAGQYILLQDGEVRWHGPMFEQKISRRVLSGEHPDHSMWLKYVDPDDMEDEQYSIYERTLKDIAARV